MTGATGAGEPPAGGSGPTPPRTPKTVYFMRHGQGFHNVLLIRARDEADIGLRDQGRALPDPGLTEVGFKQAEATRGHPLSVECQKTAEVLLVSPLRRTIQTALSAYGDTLGQRVPVVLVPALQETGECPSDCGSPKTTIVEEFGEVPCLTQAVLALPDGWESKAGVNADVGPVIAERMAAVVAYIQARPEQTLCVVAHHNVFLAMLGVSFLNCELRKFSLDGDGKWTALDPLVSASDAAWGPDDFKHMKNHEQHNVDKFTEWGFPPLGRQR